MISKKDAAMKIKHNIREKAWRALSEKKQTLSSTSPPIPQITIKAKKIENLIFSLDSAAQRSMSFRSRWPQTTDNYTNSRGAGKILRIITESMFGDCNNLRSIERAFCIIKKIASSL